MADDPKTAKRRAREMKTVSQMIALYCEGNHESDKRDQVSYCGEAVCAECKALDEYATMRTQRCRNMATKTSCDQCENHCYSPAMREAVRAVMRYSGPRMLKKHPLAALLHLVDTKRAK